MKNAKFLILYIFLHLFISCKKDDKTERLFCGAKDPLTEIEWLAEEIEAMKSIKWSTEISYCTYNNGLEGFHVAQCFEDCNSFMQWYYDCEGNFLCRCYGGIIGCYGSCDSFEVFTSELIWEYTPEAEP